MSGLTAEQDNRITDYGTTSYGKEQRVKSKGQTAKGKEDVEIPRQRDNRKGQGEGKALRECVLR